MRFIFLPQHYLMLSFLFNIFWYFYTLFSHALRKQRKKLKTFEYQKVIVVELDNFNISNYFNE